ncbi:hypothetical protein J3458_008937 [Metarhizium acridum]|uniref:uncharacterized protein n=1 Tax=Metarhizium acridum TaxID=92637 RepID=UPI001C6C99EB|nr:hypothetical protein J3458_008937 [Metarhizium acridum]
MLTPPRMPPADMSNITSVILELLFRNDFPHLLSFPKPQAKITNSHNPDTKMDGQVFASMERWYTPPLNTKSPTQTPKHTANSDFDSPMYSVSSFFHRQLSHSLTHIYLVLLRSNGHRIRHHLHHLRSRLRNGQVVHCHLLMRRAPTRTFDAEHVRAAPGCSILLA